MDYTRSPLLFRIRKAVRYTRLYGIRRTLVKVKGQYHVKRRYERLPELPAKRDPRKHVGIIGCGNFAFSNIAYYLRKNYGAIIRSAMDHDVHHAASLFEEYGLDYYTDKANELHFSTERFLINQLRKRFGFQGTPIVIKTKRPGS